MQVKVYLANLKLNRIYHFEKQKIIANDYLTQTYNVIKVQSYRSNGTNYIVYDNFDDILTPQMVTPIQGEW